MVVYSPSGNIDCSACCFDECPANFMTSCDDGHVFCLDCAKRNAETTVGNGGYVFRCMDVSGCKADFSAQELARFVEAKTLALRDKLESGEVLRVVTAVKIVLIQASIEGFVTCPFCDFGAIVENQDDKEFRCQNSECKIISCRSCRLESHIPLSCEGGSSSVQPDDIEHKHENKLAAKHQVEEAMTAALVQICNRCSKPFVKVHGCNKMTCPCGNLQ